MSSCNGEPIKFDIKPMITGGCADKRSCNAFAFFDYYLLYFQAVARLMTWDYDDPSADGDTDTPNENPTNNIHRIILQGYTLDSAGSVTAFEYVTTLTYNSKGQISSVDGPNSGTGDTVVFEYDSSTGNLLLVTSPVTGSVRFADYDNAGNPGQIVDANNIETVFTYDGRNRLLTAITDGVTESLEYTAAGSLKSLTDRAGRTLQYEYNSDHGLPETITNPAGEYLSYAYDINYNLISETLNSGQATRTWYLGWDYGDPANNTALSAGKPWKTLVPNQADTQNLETEYEYTNGNLTKITGPSGSWTEYEYDTLSRIIQTATKINDSQNAITTYGYDTMRNLTLVTDPKGPATAYTYDDAGRIVKQVSSETGTTTYAYDEAGNLKTRTDNAGQTTGYDYDAQNRLTGISYTGDNTRNITCTYDQGTNGMGKITGISDPSGTTSHSYDTLGRRTSVATTVESVTFNTAYAYDNSGKITSVTYPGGRVVTFARDATGNISSVATSYGGTTQTLVSDIAYEPFGPVKAATFSNGKTETRTHDTQYRPGAISVPGSIGLSYTYNPTGNVASMTDALADLGSFTPVIPDNEYGYVTESNKLSSLVNSQVSTTLSYDANGNITGKGDLAFEYFQDNRLSTVKQNGDVIAAYEYNASGLRTQKTAGSSTTLYHYDLNGNLICESSIDGTVLKEYIYLENLPLAMIIYGTSVISTFITPTTSAHRFFLPTVPDKLSGRRIIIPLVKLALP
nr:hypothetical protein [uncultured Desulfobacter sp.]